MLALFLMEIAHAANGSQQAAVNWDLSHAVFSASPVVQMTIMLLVGLSILCWAIAISKFLQIRRMTDLNEPFLRRFWKASSLEDLHSDIDTFAEHSGIARVFRSGFAELQKLATQKKGHAGSLQLSGADNLDRSLRKAVGQEVSTMEHRMTVLATTGATGPFIGLFGTVWGIMNSFHRIGTTGSASLAVVAPGISEALFTTAIGLVAAIPAVVLYNHFVACIRNEEIELNNFVTDFMNIAKRNFFRE